MKKDGVLLFSAECTIVGISGLPSVNPLNRYGVNF